MKNKAMDPRRRAFIKNSGSTLVGASLGLHAFGNRHKFSWNADTLKVGLVGCGGRGTGAASQAMNADPNVALTAVADIFQDRIDASLSALRDENAEKIQVDPEHQFVGFDAYQKLIDSDVDVVLLATPPVYRPLHLRKAIEAGKHVFCEKPVAVDAPGIRSVIETAKMAKEKGLALMSGFCWRFDYPKRATYERILDGAIGDVNCIYNTYNTGALWYKEREPSWNDEEYRHRNWVYYNWLSGDHIVEQAVHSLDLMSWAMGDELPVSAEGTGGRQVRTEDKFGNVYDHFAITYVYPNGTRGIHMSRQQKNCSRSYGVRMNGTKGRCEINVWDHHAILGANPWSYNGEKNNMYQTEHDELFASIRSGDPFNDGVRMANSTMLAIWGRMVAYTGQTLTWEEALNSNEQLGPDAADYKWGMSQPDLAVAMPGQTKFF